MNILEKLGLKYGTDKGTKHHYLKVYYDLFKDKRESVKKVLEIGAGEGAGLRMFRDFFPNATIYGAEIDKKRVYNINNDEPRDFRIEVFECDQSSEYDLINLISKIGGDIDLVIDDGSHKPEDQVLTCMTLMKRLHYGAIYIIEDVVKPEIAKWLYKFYPEVIKVGNRYDDRLIVMKINE